MMKSTNNVPRGFFIVDSACGSGKTTEIYHTIIQHYHEGVLYCVDTITELRKMYDSLVRQLVDTRIISPDEIMMITSEGDLHSQIMLQNYKADPNVICRKKILLLTHVRFFSSLINFFIVYNQNSQESAFNGDFNTLLSRNDLRQWIFFDETPMWIQPFATLPRCSLGLFTDNNGYCKSPNDIYATYNRYLKGTPQDPFKHTTTLDRLKIDSILSMVPIMYSRWASEDRAKDIQIFFRPIELLQPNIQTRILVFEGAGDLLFYSGQYPFLVTPSQPKYNANISFCPIPMTTKRNTGFNDMQYFESLNNVVDIIYGHYIRREKVLVTVWQNHDNSIPKHPGTSEFRDRIKGYIKHTIQQKINAPDIGDYFDVIYYGESKCKSCNDYRDYTSIVLFGKWSIPSDKTTDFNINWATNTSNLEFNIWFFVQLICRIGIRNHNGGNFRVFYTDDYSQTLINALMDYFKGIYQPKSSIQRGIDNVLLGAGIKREIKKYIIELANRDLRLKNHIVTQNTTPFTLSIPKDELKQIVPAKNDNFARSKKRLEKALARLSVSLDITKPVR